MIYNKEIKDNQYMQSFKYFKDKGIFNKVLKQGARQSIDIRFSIAVNSIIFSINFDDFNIQQIIMDFNEIRLGV